VGKDDQACKEAARPCRLSREALAMARTMGMNPKNLVKNVPGGPKQQWKAPVEQWVRDMYVKRHKSRG
jgi:hypothetical protein